MGGRKVLRTRLSVIRDSLLDREQKVFSLLYSRSQTEGQRLLTCIPAMLLLLLVLRVRGMALSGPLCWPPES